MNRWELRRRLTKWGDFNIKHMDYADELGENILYGAALLQGRVQEGAGTDKILCYETPAKIREIDRAVNKLGFAQKRAVICWYSAPLKEDGNPYTTGEIAMKIRTCKAAFELDLEAGEKRLLDILTGCA